MGEVVPPIPQELRATAYGGGVQSTALGIKAAMGEIDFPLMVFANTGDDSEHPASLAYVRDVFTPWAAARGVEVVEVCRRYADGRPYPTLRQVLTDPDRRGVPIPAFIVGERGSGMARRSCTYSWKIDAVGRELIRRGATPENPATVAMGISVDEIERAGRGVDRPYERRVYPLLDLGMTRGDCMKLIADVGLPVPRKSSCYFCPFHSPLHWRELRRDEPGLFAMAAEMEAATNSRLEADGKPERYWLHADRVPLADAVSEGQASLLGADGCDEGYCFT